MLFEVGFFQIEFHPLKVSQHFRNILYIDHQNQINKFSNTSTKPEKKPSCFWSERPNPKPNPKHNP